MKTRTSPLRDAFLEDHRRLTRGFSDLLLAIEDGDVAAAQRLAEQIDREGGAHIEFEETVYYPALRREFGDVDVDRMYEEHGVALDAIERLLAHAPARPLAEGERRELIAAIRTGLEHVISCGSMLSAIMRLDETEQTRMLRALHEARRRGRRWTEWRRARE